MTRVPRRRSASGARIAGDDYQHLVAWCWVMRAIRPGSTVEFFSVEAQGAGSVDDVVLTNTAPPHEHLQVKYAVDARSPVNTAWLTERVGARRSLLERFYRSWLELKERGIDPMMQLVTNRDIDPGDCLLALRDARTELLVPGALEVTPQSEAGRLRAQWAKHLGIEELRLLEMLTRLRLLTGRSYAAERERAEALMIGNGLRWDHQAMSAGVGRVREWVATGVRKMSEEELRKDIDKLGLRQRDPHGVLLVQAIDRDPHPEDASVVLDWVDLFKGDTPYDRREPHDANAWLDRMAIELREAGKKLRASGVRRIFVRGAMRLATWFAVGAEFRQVTGLEVSCRQGQQVWTSDAAANGLLSLSSVQQQVGQGEDLAVSVGITLDPSGEVLRYLRGSRIPVSKLVSLSLQSGIHDQVLSDSSHAIAIAQAARQKVRELVAADVASRIHLFLAAPSGLALLLGHRWNRVAPTWIYEDLGAGRGYTPTFLISA